MKIYTSEVKRSPWAKSVTVSRTRDGRWIIDRGYSSITIVPAKTFSDWDHAEWTGNAWANEELERSFIED